jgi:hypothetical protein
MFPTNGVDVFQRAIEDQTSEPSSCFNCARTDTHRRTGIMFRHGTRVEVLNHVTVTVYLVLIKGMSSSERPLGDNPFNSKKEWVK